MNSSSAWAVLTVFLIPAGGGIPAGVLLARHRGIPWPATAVLYFISDVILAFAFEPCLKGLIWAGRRVAFLGRFADALKKSVRRTIAAYGNAAGPLALIFISFAVEPMTGRAATVAAGHGFLSGWTLAITGDMLYFAMLMASTLWLDAVTGNSAVTMTVMLALMFFGPGLVRRWRERGARP